MSLVPERWWGFTKIAFIDIGLPWQKVVLKPFWKRTSRSRISASYWTQHRACYESICARTACIRASQGVQRATQARSLYLRFWCQMCVTPPWSRILEKRLSALEKHIVETGEALIEAQISALGKKQDNDAFMMKSRQNVLVIWVAKIHFMLAHSQALDVCISKHLLIYIQNRRLPSRTRPRHRLPQLICWTTVCYRFCRAGNGQYPYSNWSRNRFLW